MFHVDSKSLNLDIHCYNVGLVLVDFTASQLTRKGYLALTSCINDVLVNVFSTKCFGLYFKVRRDSIY